MFRRGAGCHHCMDTGFSGRKSVTEMLLVDQVFRDAVMQKIPTKQLHQIAVNQGMQPMWQNGLNRALKGEAPLEEILRVIAADES